MLPMFLENSIDDFHGIACIVSCLKLILRKIKQTVYKVCTVFKTVLLYYWMIYD